MAPTLDLLTCIDGRGHEFGVHGSYNSYQSAARLAHEREKMIAACVKSGVDRSVRGNRQHVLRWDALQAPNHLDAAGFEYDSTGSFAHMHGFRYGTSRAFTMWGWRSCNALRIKQKPLILMECSVIADRYMGLGYTDEAMTVMQELKKRALAYGGDFTLLWHNSHLLTEKDREFFSELVD